VSGGAAAMIGINSGVAEGLNQWEVTSPRDQILFVHESLLFNQRENLK